jgi:Flp pilus assembly protein TadG
MKRADAAKNRNRRGHAVVEVTFMMPWIFFLFAGALDMGFYSHALIATTNAARAAALYTSTNGATSAHSAKACDYARAELSGMTNARNLTSCTSLPLVVNAEGFTDSTGAVATRVTVTYQTPPMFPIPGLPGQLILTRRAEMRVRDLF